MKLVHVLAAALAAASVAMLAPQLPTVSDTEAHPRLGWSTNTIAEILTTEQAIGMRPAAISTYADFVNPFPDDWAQEARRRSIPLVLGWEPWNPALGRNDQPRYSLASIAAGKHDDFARSWAKAAKASGATILMRFAPEMNGEWQVWHKGDTPADFRNAWRHLRKVFASEKVTNVKWVFNPNVTWDGAPAYAAYWPGAKYVDWIGLDGYNFEGVIPNRTYESADAVFRQSVQELRALSPNLPLILAEAGSGPASKESWLSSLAKTAPALGARYVIWFEHNKETDWRLSTGRFSAPVPAFLSNEGWRILDKTVQKP